MALPNLIEILPLSKPVRAVISVPGSKSLTNRALILAALSAGKTTLQGALWSEDTQVMVEALRLLGFSVELQPEPEEVCNRTITVDGLAGRVPNGGTPERPLEIFVGNAGTAARFLAALVCLGQGVYYLHGVARMHERPQQALFHALRELGYQIIAENDRLPARFYGRGPQAASCQVSIEDSSQFASALLLCARRGHWEVQTQGENVEESPYVAMTSKLVEAFPSDGGVLRIEPDASSGSYFLGAGSLLRQRELREALKKATGPRELEGMLEGFSQISVNHWPESGWQIDEDFLKLISGTMPAAEQAQGGTTLQGCAAFLSLPDELSRERDLGDSIMTAAVLASFEGRLIRLTDLSRLRNQECERVRALRTELTKCGVGVMERGDTLTIFSSAHKLHGAEIETYNDHRMAMCFAILGLKVAGIKIRNPSCVKKTFPNFFQKLAAAPPLGLGAGIMEASTGRELAGEELFAN